MTAERWQRIKAVLEEASERDAGERTAFLDQVCADDRELRRQVEALLASNRNMGNFLEPPAAPLAAEARGDAQAMAGRLIGPYRIVREIGHGGMGEVYLA